MRSFFVGFAVLYGVVLAGCTSSPRWEEAYERCLKKMNPSIEKMKSDQVGSQVEKEMKQAMVGFAEGMAVSMCETVKDVCQKDPDGTACEGVLKSLE